MLLPCLLLLVMSLVLPKVVVCCRQGPVLIKIISLWAGKYLMASKAHCYVGILFIGLGSGADVRNKLQHCTLRLKSCWTGLDSTKQVNLMKTFI